MSQAQLPTGITRFFFRLPIYCYKLGLGWLLGGRFVLLHHRGRKSGLPREVVIEVVKHDSESGDYFVCSGFGEKSQWYQNLMAAPDTNIQVGGRKMAVHAARVSPDEGSGLMQDYTARHPAAAKRLAKFMGFTVDGNPGVYEQVGQTMPFIRLSQQDV